MMKGSVIILFLFLIANYTSANSYKEYIVNDGETVTEILEFEKLYPIYGATGSLEEFLELNPSKKKDNGDLIYPGERIILPVKTNDLVDNINEEELDELDYKEDLISKKEPDELDYKEASISKKGPRKFFYNISLGMHNISYQQDNPAIIEIIDFVSLFKPFFALGINYHYSDNRHLILHYKYANPEFDVDPNTTINKNTFDFSQVNLALSFNKKNFNYLIGYSQHLKPIIAAGLTTDTYLSVNRFHLARLGFIYKDIQFFKNNSDLFINLLFPVTISSGDSVSFNFSSGFISTFGLSVDSNLLPERALKYNIEVIWTDYKYKMSTDFNPTKFEGDVSSQVLNASATYNF